MTKITSILFKASELKEASSQLIEARHVAEKVFESHGEWIRWEDYMWLTLSDTFIGEVAHSKKGTFFQFKEYGMEHDKNSFEVFIGGKRVLRITLKRAKAWAKKMGYV